jgi:acyl-CoA synthetase (NDP forming)
MEHESKAVLESLGITTTGAGVAKSEDEAVEIFQSLAAPVAMKVLSPDVVHKSDAGGVKLNLRDAEVRAAYREITRTFMDKKITGISVQKMARPGVEAIVGVANDATFGPILMFGLGGVFVEVLKDVSFRSIPISASDAKDMIEEIKGYALLRGYRGISADIEALENLLMTISDYVMKKPDISEMDLNPVFLYPMATVVDARQPGRARLAPQFAVTQDLRPVLSQEHCRHWASARRSWAGTSLPILSATDSEVCSVPSIPRPMIHDCKNIPASAPCLSQWTCHHPCLGRHNRCGEECCKCGVRYIVVESAGFAELGEDGKKIELLMKDIADKYGVRLLGPNCSGIINTHCSMVQSIGIVDALSMGNIGLVSQAGVCAAGMLWGLRHIMDFGIIATIGNKLDIKTDILEAVSKDENINVICMYLESVKGGRRFIDAARRITLEKPIVVLKSGRTDAGNKAVASHTASLAGNDQIFSAAFRQSGIIRARDYDHMFNLARAISKQPLPTREGVFIITYAGSLGVIAADAITDNGMRLSELEPPLKERLKSLLLTCLGMNPVDYTFSQDAETVKRTIEIGVDSQDVGSFIVVLQAEILGSYVDTLKKIDYQGKPIIACVAGKEFAQKDVIKMEKAGIPVFGTPEQVADALGIMYRHHKRVARAKS